ncbi:predicted protein [Chaetoceros tenuissimus]|uniref:Uncharacterized protein n=1 Tax=Chaetoceros tenuissimus TaxID=426638 RepID=A0AAD3CQ74_9STRA|nr:predicted protein [Chaetoceros tenuissimus]
MKCFKFKLKFKLRRRNKNKKEKQVTRDEYDGLEFLRWSATHCEISNGTNIKKELLELHSLQDGHDTPLDLEIIMDTQSDVSSICHNDEFAVVKTLTPLPVLERQVSNSNASDSLRYSSSDGSSQDLYENAQLRRLSNRLGILQMDDEGDLEDGGEFDFSLSACTTRGNSQGDRSVHRLNVPQYQHFDGELFSPKYQVFSYGKDEDDSDSDTSSILGLSLAEMLRILY